MSEFVNPAVAEAEAVADKLMENARAAAAVAETLTQEQVDRIVRNIGKVIYDNADMLAAEAVAETKMGIAATKAHLNRMSPTTTWNYLKDKKSVGVLHDDKINRVLTLAKPMGVIGCVTPCTNTATPVFNSMIALKGRNVVIIAAHPRAVNNGRHMVQLMRAEIEKLGFPADMIQIAEPCSLEMTEAVMKRVDAVVATGGFGMVKAAYSSGKPSFGVGQGNAQCILHPSYTDYETMVGNIMMNRTADNGVPCVGEQTLILPRDRVDAVLAVFRARGAAVIEKPEDVDKIRKGAFVNGEINRAVVGQLPHDAARMMGVDVPEDAKILIVRAGEAYGKDEPLCREMMFPVVRMFVYDRFEDGVEIARANLLNEGAGHSSTVYAEDDAAIEYAANRLPVCRVLVNLPNGAASGMDYNNGLVPTNSIGCGSWGNNSISENLNYNHLMNMTKVAYPLAGFREPTPEEVWGE